MQYTQNPQAAKEADSGGFINTTGDYIGVFTAAKAIVSEQKGTKGIEFSFKDRSGATANYLSIWTNRADGSEIYGFKQLSAIMAILGLPGINPSQGMVEEYDPDQKTMVNVPATIYADLMNKPIGVLLQLEEYKNGNGDIKEKMAFQAAFHHDSRKIALEILNGTEAKRLPAMINSLRDKRLQETPTQQSSQPSAAGSPVPDDFGDDIPW